MSLSGIYPASVGAQDFHGASILASPGALTIPQKFLIDSTGNFYIVGFSRTTLYGGTNADGSDNAIIAKYTDRATQNKSFVNMYTSALLWGQNYGANLVDRFNDVAIDTSGNIYACGTTNTSLLGQSNLGSSDGVLIKFNPSGAVSWTRQFGSTGADTANGVCVDSSNNVWVTGTIFTPGTHSNAYIAKYSSSGSLLFRNEYNSISSANEEGFKCEVDGSDFVYIVGTTQGAFVGTSAGLGDVWVRKIDSSGSIQWTDQIGSNASDTVPSIKVLPDGTSYVGLTVGSGGSLPGNTSAGGLDPGIVKYSNAGTRQWVVQPGSPGTDAAYSLDTDSAGNVYLVGQSVPIGSTIPAATIRKLTPSGSLLWARYVTTPGTTVFTDIVIKNDILYCTGHTLSTFPGYTDSNTSQKMFMARLDTEGALL